MRVAPSPEVRHHAIKIAYRDVRERMERIHPGVWAQLSPKAREGAVEAQLAAMKIRVVDERAE
jgi:hypothetical protein